MTEHYKDKPLGIFTDAECLELIQVLDRLQETEHRLFEFCRDRIEYEGIQDKRQQFAEKQDLEVANAADQAQDDAQSVLGKTKPV